MFKGVLWSAIISNQYWKREVIHWKHHSFIRMWPGPQRHGLWRHNLFVFGCWRICEKASDNCRRWFIRKAAYWCKCINYRDKFSWLEHCINQQMIWNLCGINCICLCRYLVSELQSSGARKHENLTPFRFLLSQVAVRELISPATSKIQLCVTVGIAFVSHVTLLWSCVTATEPEQLSLP